MPASSCRALRSNAAMSYQARIDMPLLIVTGRTGACGNTKRNGGHARSTSCGTIGAKSLPSAPRPSSQVMLCCGLAAVSSSRAGRVMAWAWWGWRGHRSSAALIRCCASGRDRLCLQPGQRALMRGMDVVAFRQRAVRDAVDPFVGGEHGGKARLLDHRENAVDLLGAGEAGAVGVRHAAGSIHQEFHLQAHVESMLDRGVIAVVRHVADDRERVDAVLLEPVAKIGAGEGT